MIKLFSICILLLLGTVSFAQNSGGPDNFGYTWKNSNDPSGPTYNWIDIVPMGTLVTGLADDNSVMGIGMGMDFQYYWETNNIITIGSNGWLSFDNEANIGQCFPSIPTQDASNNYLAAFMMDLNFLGASNPGKVYYYHDPISENFIVSYINVPWWKQFIGHVGSNTFQIILSQLDSSITYQYQFIDTANFTGWNCWSDLVVGIENPIGDDGIQAYVDSLYPENNMAIKFYFPDNVNLDYEDVSPLWVQNEKSQAEYYSLSDFTVAGAIQNSGNLDITDSIDVFIRLEKVNYIGWPSTYLSHYTSQIKISGLMVDSSALVEFSIPAAPEGDYRLSLIAKVNNDFVPGNDALHSELKILDLDGLPEFEMSYFSGSPYNSGQYFLNAGDEVCVQFVPKVYPIAVEAVIIGYGYEYVIREVYADDGPDNSPGTLLTSEPFNGNTFFSNPPIIYSGGVYACVKAHQSMRLAYNVVDDGPISRRSYASDNVGWFSNNTTDPAIRAFFTKNVTSIENHDFNADDRSIYPNPTNGIVYLNNIKGISNVSVYSNSGQEIMNVEMVNENQLDLKGLSPGIYFLKIIGKGEVKVEKIILN